MEFPWFAGGSPFAMVRDMSTALVHHAEDVFRFLRWRVAPSPPTALWVMSLEAARDRTYFVRRGRNWADVPLGELFGPLLDHNASACVLAHHHPSGNPEPSDEDVYMTRYLRE